MDEGVPLCVDLDGTLLRTDVGAESYLLFLKESPLKAAFLGAMWLLRGGRARFKRELATRVPLPPDTLPYNPDVLEYCRRQSAGGRTLVLATGADEIYAGAVSKHLGIFAAVLASDGNVNLVGAAKAAALERRFGKGGFDYAGDSRADWPVWRRCRRAITVGLDRTLLSRLGAEAEIEKSFERRRPSLRALLSAARPHQWAKNLLVFTPLVTSHKLLHMTLATDAAAAALIFCLLASSAYILNDLLDLAADRAHPAKKLRPLASGELSPWRGLAAAGMLAAAGLGLSALSSARLLAVAGGYWIFAVLYTLRIKDIPLVDALWLAMLYSLRVLAGHAATGVALSSWLSMFTVFFFLSLALAKRAAELRSAGVCGDARVRGYLRSDLETVESLGVSSGFGAALVFLLYANSSHARALYSHPAYLWLVCPLLIYWIGRLWLLARRGLLDEDPMVFALRDKASYFIAAAALLLIYAGSR